MTKTKKTVENIQADLEKVTPPPLRKPVPHVSIDEPIQEELDKVGFTRKGKVQIAFDEAVDTVLKMFPEDVMVEDGTSPILLSLDASIVATEESEVSHSIVSMEQLNWLHVEPLLDQTADILDRSLNTRQLHDEQSVKMLTLLLELREYVELDRIHTQEEADGLYDVSYKRAQAEYIAEFANIGWSSYISDRIQQTADDTFTGDKYNVMWLETARGAMTNGSVPYSFGDQVFDGYVNHNWYGKNQHVSHHSVDSATTQLYHSFQFQYDSLYNQAASFSATEAVAKQRLIGLKANADWARKNRTFLRSRTNVARKYQDIKMRAATLPNGVLNHARRLPGLRQRFENDIRFAIPKLVAIQKGLSQIYGYSVPLPVPEDNDYLDQLIKWTRTAIQWLITFADSDQSLALPISLREIIGDDAWVRGVADGYWDIQLNLNDFLGLSHLRLRGVSVIIVPRTDIERKCGQPRRIYRFELNAPKIGDSMHNDGNIIEVDQSLVQPVIFARVSNRDSIREPDVVGIAALHNVCPCGTWRLTLAGGVPSNRLNADLLVDLEDIEIDFHLTYNRVKVD